MTLDIAAHLAKVRRAILALGGTVSRFEVLPPAQEADVRRMESQIGRAFPRAMRRFFLEQSAGVEIHWELPDHARGIPKPLQGISGSCDFSLADQPIESVNWSGWRDAFAAPEEHGWPAEMNLDVYSVMFPLLSAGGDQIVLLCDDEVEVVMYLDHEGGDWDRLVLHSDAPSFMESWFRLGCPGPEDEVLGVFLDARSRCISSESRLGREWLSVLDRAAATGGRGS